jgi:hypothetical protein
MCCNVAIREMGLHRPQMLPEDLTIAGRLVVTNTLSANESKNVLQTVLDSIRLVLQKADEMVPAHEVGWFPRTHARPYA